MHILQHAAGSSPKYGPRRFLAELGNSRTVQAFKETLKRGYERIQSGLIVNNSDHPVYAKSEYDERLFVIEPKSSVRGPFDGVASWNPEQGKVIKCRDFSVAYIAPDGRVVCQELGFIDHTIPLNTPPDEKWKPIFDVAEVLQSQVGAPEEQSGSLSHVLHETEQGPSNHTNLGDFVTSPGIGSTV
jgi:hypothetical protein